MKEQHALDGWDRPACPQERIKLMRPIAKAPLAHEIAVQSPIVPVCPSLRTQVFGTQIPAICFTNNLALNPTEY